MSEWKCPKCGRLFRKKGQQHSCTVYPVEKHFKGKEEIAKPLYEKLQAEIKEKIGSFRVESLPCCIHLVGKRTFAAVYALRNGIRLHFTLDCKLESKRIGKFSQMSAKRFLYSLDIKKESEMDKELIGWLKQAYAV